MSGNHKAKHVSRQARNGLMLREALRYAGLGVYVIPLDPETSTPIYPDALNEATCDVEKIRSWWAEHPKANIGARLSGVWGLEVTDAVGYHALSAREEVHGPLPKTWTCGSDIRTLYLFKHSNGDTIPTTKDEYAIGIATHGADSFVILPPSILPNGKTLTWTHGPNIDDLATCDAQDVLDWIRLRNEREKAEGKGTKATDSPKAKVKPDGPKENGKSKGDDKGDFVCAYVYTDENGQPLHRTTRWFNKETDKKTFRQGAYEGDGMWARKLGKCRLVLYRLPAVMKADVVWLCEGEKDVESLEKLGLCATTAPMGAEKWNELVQKHRILEPLKGKTVYKVVDCDEPGVRDGHMICTSLTGHAKVVKLISIPCPPLSDAKSDVSDLIARQGPDEAKRILDILVDQTPEYVPSEEYKAPKPRADRAKSKEGAGSYSGDNVKDRVKKATDIVELIRETVDLKPDGKEFAGLCPLHGDTTPSLRVNPAKQSWYCHGCKIGGDVYKWVTERDKVGFREALKTLAVRAGIQIDGRKKKSSSSAEGNATGAEGNGTSTALDERRAKIKAVIDSRLTRLEEKDISLLDDEIFISAVSWVERHWPSMFQVTLDSARKSNMVNALKNAYRIYRAGQAAKRKAKHEKDSLPSFGHLLTEVAKLKPPSEEAGGLNMPRDYGISERGEITRLIWKDDQPQETPICAFPVLPVRRFQTISECKMFVELAWYERKQWHAITAPMSQAVNVRDLTGLSGQGFPVGSDTAKELQIYIRAMIQTNTDKLKPDALSDHSGWIRTGPPIFLYGRTPIAAATDAAKVKLQVQSGGEEDILDAFEKPQGDLASWLTMISEIKSFPVAKIALYAGFASVLLEPLGLQPFTIDISGTSSKGKTTVTALSASAWGNPRIGAGLFDGWDSTKVNLERTLSLLNGLPVYKDDSSNANPRDIQGHLYGIAAGSGRGRGNKAGLARRTKYRGLVITNGEAPLTDSAAKEGAAVRVLSVREAPFGTDKTKSLRAVQAIEKSVHQHYGHAGPAFVKWLVDHWEPEDWRRRFDEIRGQYKGESEFAVRLSGYAAVVSLAGELLHKAVEMPWEYEDPWLTSGLWEQVDFQLRDVPMGYRALRMIVDFAGSSPHAFFDPDSPEDQRPPFGGWAGRASSLESWSYIDVHPTWLGKFCSDNGFNQNAVVGHWRQCGWITTKELSVNARFGKAKTTRVFRVTRAACDEVTGLRRKAESRDKGPECSAKGFIPKPESCSVHVPGLGVDIPVPGWDGDMSTLPKALESFNVLLSKAVLSIEDYIESVKGTGINDEM